LLCVDKKYGCFPSLKREAVSQRLPLDT